MKVYDFKKAEESGVTNLHMGGEILNGGFFREKDVMNDDYSEPRLSGKYSVDFENYDEKTGLFTLHLTNGAEDARFLLTKDEYEAGLLEENEEELR